MENKTAKIDNEVVNCEILENEFENVLVLKRPVMIDGEEVTEIKYDTDKLNGGSIEKAIGELAKRKIGVAVPELDLTLHAQLFAYASNLDYTDIQRFSISDYVKVTSIIRNFFVN